MLRCVCRMEAAVLVRIRILFLLLLVFSPLAIADDKKKILLPAYVLRARTVLVLIDPDAGTSMTSPLANKTAQEDVEKALMKWGRLAPVLEGQDADLVITVRKGSEKIVQPTIGGEPTNDRPIIVQQTDNSIRIGAQQGHPVGAPQTTPQDTKPHAQMEAVPPEDVFLVYDGSRGPRPDGTPVWHYMAKNGLRSPGVPAVAEFRKIIEAAEKEQKGKP